MAQQLDRGIDDIRRADLLHLQFGRSGELEEILENRIDVPDFLGNDLKVLFLIRGEFQAAPEGKHPHFHRSQRVAHTVRDARGKFAHHGQFSRLQEVLAAYLEFRLGLVNIRHQAVHAPAERLYLIGDRPRLAPRVGRVRKLPNRVQDAINEHIG